MMTRGRRRVTPELVREWAGTALAACKAVISISWALRDALADGLFAPVS